MTHSGKPLESWKYIDPQKTGDRLWTEADRELRESKGCAACAHKDFAWGMIICGIGNTPGKRGFCPEWQKEDE